MTDPFADIDPGSYKPAKEKTTVGNTTAPRNTEKLPGKDIARAAVTNAESGTVMHSMARARDFAPRGTVVPMAEIEGRELALWGMEEQKTRFGTALKLTLSDIPTAEDGGEIPDNFLTFTSGAALVPALKGIEEQVQAGTLEYPLAVCFRLVQGGGDQPYWVLD